VTGTVWTSPGAQRPARSAFYPTAAFADAGYQVPETWDELIRLSRRIVEDGRSPWCMAFESGFPFNGWPGTDLIESLVLSASASARWRSWTPCHTLPRIAGR